MKRTVPVIITALVGFVLIIAYFMPFFGDLGDIAAIFFDVLASIAFILGGGNLLRAHGEKIYKQHSGWAYSLIAVVTFAVTLVFGLGKFGVPTPYNQGVWTEIMRSGKSAALVEVRRNASAYDLVATVRKAEPNGTVDLNIGGQSQAQIKLDELGDGDLHLSFDTEEPEKHPGNEWIAQVAAGATVQIGSLSGALRPYARITGDHIANGSYFWWMYEYGFRPLQQTTFAMLAFYVASAAFRAFRAKNIESVMLLGTAFLILLGRTVVGHYATMWAADPAVEPEGAWEQFLSFFYMPYLSEWFMDVFNTAGNRAIMIGIALGVASTSLKVLLGIDRSYLGSE
ncbi:MAG: hypothetical protein D6744_14480 [Planctomycetota bacterium]|nr:MAG: hypothetical protein D6744_14480 [Planctomycetota bacterium]